jgi:ribonuclease HII
VAGIDEAGRGPLAGPVVAAAVVLPERISFRGANDSKRLSPRVRERLFDVILTRADDVAWCAIGPELIDRLNILRATHLAMRLAFQRLRRRPDAALIDGNPLSSFPSPHEAIVGGDASELSIACASIVAKVVRDRMMGIYDALYEGYGFADHMGYATASHLAAIRQLGPSPIHRYSFTPVGQTTFPI